MEKLREITSKLFAFIDKDNNKRLSKAEMLAFFKMQAENHQEPFSEEDFVSNWNKMDANNDNSISEEEFFNYMVDKARKSGNLAAV